MKIKCAIFDFDGTLFDSMFIWDNIAETYLRSVGKIPKPNVREDVRELSLYQSACYFQREYDIALSVKQIMTGINQTIEHFYINELLPKPGVIEFLEQMQKSEISMCIATASDRYQIEVALKRCKMQKYFDSIFTCSEVGYGKNEPVIYRKAIESFEANRCETIVFEDALHAVQTAKKDGFTVVAVFDNSEMRQDEIRNLSDFYMESFENTEDFWKFVST